MQNCNCCQKYIFLKVIFGSWWTVIKKNIKRKNKPEQMWVCHIPQCFRPSQKIRISFWRKEYYVHKKIVCCIWWKSNIGSHILIIDIKYFLKIIIVHRWEILLIFCLIILGPHSMHAVKKSISAEHWKNWYLSNLNLVKIKKIVTKTTIIPQIWQLWPRKYIFWILKEIIW